MVAAVADMRMLADHELEMVSGGFVDWTRVWQEIREILGGGSGPSSCSSSDECFDQYMRDAARCASLPSSSARANCYAQAAEDMADCIRGGG